MAVLYGNNSANLGSTPPTSLDGDLQMARVRVVRERITLASQATTDTIVLGNLPIGASFLYGMLLSTVSLGTATIAIGITGTTGKYRAAATFTATDTPTPFGVASNLANKLTVTEQVFITIGTAALPASGTLYADLYYAMA